MKWTIEHDECGTKVDIPPFNGMVALVSGFVTTNRRTSSTNDFLPYARLGTSVIFAG
jgi:hypothetical protein